MQHGLTTQKYQVRLARTIAGGETYPTVPARTYAIRFIDGATMPAEGSSTEITWSDRCETYQALAYSLLGPVLLPEDSVVAVARYGEKWFILSVEPPARMICGTLGGALTATTASQTISSPVAMDGGVLPTGTITGYNVYTSKGFAGPSGGRCVAAWNAATGHYEFIDVECV